MKKLREIGENLVDTIHISILTAIVLGIYIIINTKFIYYFSFCCFIVILLVIFG